MRKFLLKYYISVTLGLSLACLFALEENVVQVILIVAIMVGILFFILAGILQLISNLLTKKFGSGLWDVKHEAEIILNRPYIDTYDLCKEAIEEELDAMVTTEDKEEGSMEARTGLNVKTWGDHLFVSMKKWNEERTHVRIKSEPSVSTTIVDFGKKKNVEGVYALFGTKGFRNRCISCTLSSK